MLELGYPFDTVQMPLNPFDFHFRSFETQVLPEVNRRGIAALGMKSMGGTGQAVKKGVTKAQDMLRYAMSLPVATTISGIDSLKILEQNLQVARGFKPMSEVEMNSLRAQCAETAADGRFETYKVSLKFDNHLGTIGSQKDVDQVVHEALDAGVNFLDNAWEYNDGRSEEVVGHALRGKREQVFLMTKVCSHGRDKKVAMRQLEQSLQRLKTDRLDLWQVHEVIYENDPDWHFRSAGVIDALDEAKKQGKVRFVGFTGHKQPAIHLKMLAHDYPFDTVQMPLNCFDGSFRSFERLVLPEALRRGIAVLGMKSLGGDGQSLIHGIVRPEEALRYAMSLPVATTISGIDSLSVLHQNLAIARDFVPLSEEEMNALRQRCAPFAADGHLELYKTTTHYDGKVGREQHGYPTPEEMPI